MPPPLPPPLTEVKKEKYLGGGWGKHKISWSDVQLRERIYALTLFMLNVNSEFTILLNKKTVIYVNHKKKLKDICDKKGMLFILNDF